MTEQMSPVNFIKKEAVATITLNRPPANAYNMTLMRSFFDAIKQANEDADVDVVIIKSSSEKFFCAGADIKEFEKNDTRANQQMVDQARVTSGAIENSEKIFIAQIAGHTLGGGLEIAMACDLRFAASGNYLLGLPEIKLGLIPGNGGTQRLVRLIGLSRAMDILITGDSFSVQEAESWGLINRLYDPQDLEDAVINFARAIASGPALALAATKKALREGMNMSLSDALLLEHELSDSLYDTRDADEGFQAHLEKRSPDFRGH